MLETILVYGLVLAFFLLFMAFVIVVLASHPYTEPSSTAHIESFNTSISNTKHTDVSANTKVAYGVLVFIFACLLVVTVLEQRNVRID